jgi:hypothetical protein
MSLTSLGELVEHSSETRRPETDLSTNARFVTTSLRFYLYEIRIVVSVVLLLAISFK